MTDAVSFAVGEKWSDSIRFSGAREDIQICDAADRGGPHRDIRRIRLLFRRRYEGLTSVGGLQGLLRGSFLLTLTRSGAATQSDQTP
jgi:hypothetical protein